MPPRLGRIVEFDERSRNYPVRTLISGVAPKYKYWWDGGAFLDQGATGTCVGHAWAHWAEDSPVTHPSDAVDPFLIYRDACKRDPWPENDAGDLDYGTSVLAGVQGLHERGIVESYHWCFSLDDLRLAVLTKGPVVVGTYWYNSMWSTQNGFLPVDEASGIAGGHAYEVNGANDVYKRFRIKNSWGQGWGVAGRAYINYDDMAKLLANEGEACIAIERKVG